MREIKFRALNALNNMVYFSLFHSGLDGDTFKSPVMQFTGLHDKNGKEIYEGDIVKTENLTASEILEFGRTYKGEIKFEPTQGYYLSGLGRFEQYCEVIGNIYENPELVK